MIRIALGAGTNPFGCHDFRKCLAGNESSIERVGDPWEMKNVSIDRLEQNIREKERDRDLMLSINKPEIFVPEIGIGGNIKREGRVFRPSRERERESARA